MINLSNPLLSIIRRRTVHEKRVAAIVGIIIFYALLVFVCVLDTINYRPVISALSNLFMRSKTVFAIWYIRFLAYALLGAGYGAIVHIVPILKTEGKWVYKWKTAILWGWLPILLPIWFTLYYEGIVDLRPVHMLRSVPNISLYNIMGLVFGSSLTACLKKTSVKNAEEKKIAHQNDNY